MIKVGIIDSGIFKDHTRFTSINFSFNSFVNDDSKDLIVDSHGTAVFDVIRKTTSRKADISQFCFYDLKVFNQPADLVEENVINAIKFSIENKLDVVNISLGLMAEKPSKELYHVCKQAYEKGIIIIAAADNLNRVCYPAYFPFCLGVTGGVIDNIDTYGVIDNSQIEFIGKGTFQRLAALNNECVFIGGTSYATGQITGLTALKKLENKNFSFEEIKTKLKEKGKRGIRLITRLPKQNYNIQINKDTDDIDLSDLFCPDKKQFFNKKIAFYPVSIKEFNGLSKFHNLCPFEITDLIDYPRSAILNKTMNLGDNVTSLKFSVESFSEETDIIVIGYPFEMGLEINNKFYDEIIDFYLKKHKAFIVFDLSCYKEIETKREEIGSKSTVYIPSFDIALKNKLNLLQTKGKVDKPVLCVVGSSPKAGKFTAQLHLKKILQKEGYKVGWLSTEPQGELFGANFCFPMGFESTVNICTDMWISTLDNIMKGIEIYTNPDIIITGHQGGLIPFARNNYTADTTRNNVFLFGVRPDAIICVFNFSDEISLIENTIYSLKHYYQYPILYIILSTKAIEYHVTQEGLPPIAVKIDIPKENWIIKAKELETKFEIPVVNNFDSDYDTTIVNSIESFFS